MRHCRCVSVGRGNGIKYASLEVEPMNECLTDLAKLWRCQHPKSSDKVSRRDRLQALDEKCSLRKKSSGNRHLELRAAGGSCVWNDANQSSIALPVSDADYQCWTDLLSDTKIDQPDFATLRHRLPPPLRPRREKRLRPALQNRRP